ncbi:MAG: DegT/DnrJ/EryC1/StrS family aminotransferase [Pseudomonadales bacterium]|nr:DegT/DnrJ/EryC1/StrS family aminotransferase [Pseudomonadales bacterium]MBO6595984.1 DegT/DnrJ/EryC1/StrS family aminotransferase [Pseudomonadales bacterium]MBO6822467.1 DegT/DnrJ/EryC1/StrS family aminotransferase [Pseudomonadales bacterium]
MTNEARVPFFLPTIGEEEINEVLMTLKSGWLTTGAVARRFEEAFSNKIGGGVQSISVNSATAGLHLALEAVGVERGDEVITSPFTFTATCEVIRYLGADPVFVDIDPNSLNIDVHKIEAAITEKTKAILPVHFAGLACEMGEIVRIARKHDLKVVEDAAHALPTYYENQMIGSLDTDATVFSFYATKTITTGEGGMVVTKNQEIADRCRTMRLHGISRDAFDRYTNIKPDWYYEVVAPGFKYNLTDLAASIGVHQVERIDSFMGLRKSIAEYYSASLAECPIDLPPSDDGHAWHLYTIRLQQGAWCDRDTFINEMSEQGVSCSVHFIPLHLQPYWRDTYSLTPEQFPVSTQTYTRIISLPLFPSMTQKQMSKVVAAVKSVLQCC